MLCMRNETQFYSFFNLVKKRNRYLGRNILLLHFLYPYPTILLHFEYKIEIYCQSYFKQTCKFLTCGNQGTKISLNIILQRPLPSSLNPIKITLAVPKIRRGKSFTHNLFLFHSYCGITDKHYNFISIYNKSNVDLTKYQSVIGNLIPTQRKHFVPTYYLQSYEVFAMM